MTGRSWTQAFACTSKIPSGPARQGRPGPGPSSGSRSQRPCSQCRQMLQSVQGRGFTELIFKHRGSLRLLRENFLNCVETNQFQLAQNEECGLGPEQRERLLCRRGGPALAAPRNQATGRQGGDPGLVVSGAARSPSNTTLYS